MKAILAMAKGYVRDFAKKQENLLLIGPTGTGKTHISTAIAGALIHEGYDVIYDSTQNIISDFEADRFRSNYGREESKSEKSAAEEIFVSSERRTTGFCSMAASMPRRMVTKP